MEEKFNAEEVIDMLREGKDDLVQEAIAPHCDNCFGEGVVTLHGHSYIIESVWRDHAGDINIHISDSECEGDLLFKSLLFSNQCSVIRMIENIVSKK